MALSRRQAVLAALSAGVGSALLGGCASTRNNAYTYRPTAQWPTGPARPASQQRYTPVNPATPQPAAPPSSARPAALAGLDTIGRSKWTRTGPVRSKVNPMAGISKITIHHEGWTPVYFTATADTAERIEKIRKYHVGNNRWGDIGYHYIIDRAGRIWEGRPIQYQGAHVRNNNEHNVGILVMGNFEKQSPSSAQMRSLYDTTKLLTSAHGIKANRVRSHKEINPTTCPGKSLQRQMEGLRRHVA